MSMAWPTTTHVTMLAMTVSPTMHMATTAMSVATSMASAVFGEGLGGQRQRG
jgi:hypothetical protein